MGIVNEDRLWSGNSFAISRFDNYLARVRNVPKDAVPKWQTALETASGSTHTKRDALLTMIDHDPLFTGTQFSGDSLNRSLARLKSLPPETVTEWAEASHAKGKSAAALAIIRVDDAFQNDVFQKTLFKLY